MNKEEIETVIGSYLGKARNISHKFGMGDYGQRNYIEQFVNSINLLPKQKTITKCKIENFNQFIDELLTIQKRINELKDSID